MQQDKAFSSELVKNLHLSDSVVTVVDADALLSDCVKTTNGVLTSNLALSGCGLMLSADSYVQIGNHTQALSARQFVWSGNDTSAYSGFNKGEGSFCINPSNGLSGFYVGDESLDTILNDRGGSTIKAELKASLDSIFLSAENIDDVDFTSVTSALSSLWMKLK